MYPDAKAMAVKMIPTNKQSPHVKSSRPATARVTVNFGDTFTLAYWYAKDQYINGYTARLLIGSNEVERTFIFDNSFSDNLVIVSSLLDGTQNFPLTNNSSWKWHDQPGTSNAVQWIGPTYKDKNLVTPYHPARDWGNPQTFPCSSATDRMCINSDWDGFNFNCINSFPFCGYYHASDDSWTDIMGMWYGNKSGGTFTELMRAAGFINHSIFGMLIDHNINDGPHYSYIDFGIFN